jgi:hypothetical protein
VLAGGRGPSEDTALSESAAASDETMIAPPPGDHDE